MSLEAALARLDLYVNTKRLILQVGGDQVPVVKHWVTGDTTPLTMAIQDEDGGVVNLTNYTGKFFMRLYQPSGAIGSTPSNKVNGSAIVITSAASGYCEYRWAAGDVDTAGTYECEVELTDGSGYKVTTEPIRTFHCVMRAGLG